MFVKICGVRSAADIDAAVLAGVDAVGLNLVPSSRRFLAAAEREVLASQVPSSVKLFWVVASTSPPVEDLLQRFPTSYVQRTDAAFSWPDGVGVSRRVDVVRLVNDADVERASTLAASFLLSDASGTLGGSGHRADWTLTAALAKHRRVILAGGLSPANVKEAILKVRPFGVDVASGVERSPGQKDAGLMRAFVLAAKGALP